VTPPAAGALSERSAGPGATGDASARHATPTARAAASRLDFIDALRGLAVLLMILWHTVDAWLVDAARTAGGHDTPTFAVLRYLGGGAAPLFTLLAGASLALKAASDARRGVSARASVATSVARGLELVVLGYLLRLQFFAIDAGGVREPRALVPLLGGLLLLLAAVRAAARRAASPASPRAPSAARAAWLALGGAALYALGLLALAALRPERLPSVLRVDVLQAIGASLVALALVEPLLRRWPAAAVPLALAVAAVSDALGAALPGPLPAPLAAYVARWPAAPGERPLAMFPLSPWLAFPLVGYAVGRAWDASARRGTALRDVALIGGSLGLALAVAANETVVWRVAPALLRAEPWLLPALRVLARTGMALAFASACAVFVRFAPPRLEAPLRRFGRASLFVYWVHLELTFGVVATPLKRRLDLPAWLGAFLALTALMYALVLLKDGPAARAAARAREARAARARRAVAGGT
jgi:uncharacterized membrane protein